VNDVDITGWKIIGWTYVKHNTWTCALLKPNGSRYEPNMVGGEYINKKIGQPYFTVFGYGEAHAKEKLREFIRSVQLDDERKARGPQDFAFTPGGNPKPLDDMTERLKEMSRTLRESSERLKIYDEPRPAPDTSWVETEDIKQSGREPKKSLWNEWRDKRAARRNQATEQQDSDSKKDS
jgi:hypothetical protein